VTVQKVLLTNARTLTAAQVVQRYDLRWQIEIDQASCRSSGRLYLGCVAA
jgi:hypothetical protein